MGENTEICASYLKRMAPRDLILEMEFGTTGVVEDVVDGSGVSKEKHHSTPKDVCKVWLGLSPICEKFTIAAAFGNVLGVYKAGNVKLQPELETCQKYAPEVVGAENPLFFVFHGGSGFEKNHRNCTRCWRREDERGHVKNFCHAKECYLQRKIGNPEDADKPNKGYHDREGELTMEKRVQESCDDLRNVSLGHFSLPFSRFFFGD